MKNKVKIIKIKKPTLWYKNHKGKEFELIEEDGLFFKVKNPKGKPELGYNILKEDAELV